MLPYFFVFISVSIFGFLIDFSKSKIIKIFLSALVIFAFLPLYYYRDYGIGTDTLNYIPIFQDIFQAKNIIEYSIDYNIEIGFAFTVYMLSLISQDYFFIFTCLTAVVYINLISSLHKYNLSFALFLPSMFCVFQLYFFSYNIIRQMVAVSFLMLAVSHLLRNNNKKFVIYCFLSFIFHYSSIFIFTFYFIYKFRYVLVRFWYLVVTGIILLLSILFNLVVGGFEKYSAYNVADSITDAGGLLLNSLYIILFLSAIYIRKYISYMRSEFYFFLALYGFYISLSIYFLTAPFLNQGMVRIATYFLWASVFIILIFIKNISNNYLRYIVCCLYYLFLVAFTYYFLSNANYELVPYRLR